MNENCEYITNAHKNKNCYLVDEVDICRDCLYGYNIQHCEDIVDGFYIRDSKLCYHVSQAENCYEVFYSHNVHNSSNCAFMNNCRNCKNCLFCTNLRNAEYHLFNKKVSETEFEEAWKFLFSGSQVNLDQCRERFEAFLAKEPTVGTIQNNTENCTGDQLFNCKDCFDCFNIDNCRDCRYSTDIHYSKDCYDIHIYEGELMYEGCHVGPKGYNNLFTRMAWFSSNTFYCDELRNCKNVFACSGLKNKEYCVFNKQYEKEEYEKLVGKIIGHMIQTGEWGEFFPANGSPYGYSQTIAAYYFPLNEKEATSKGFNWTLPDESSDNTSSTQKIPESLGDFSDDMLDTLFASIESDKPYRVTAQELKFHKQYNLPLPQNTPAERLQQFVQENPRKLTTVSCQKCGREVESTFLPENGRIVYCEECYFNHS